MTDVRTLVHSGRCSWTVHAHGVRQSWLGGPKFRVGRDSLYQSQGSLRTCTVNRASKGGQIFVVSIVVSCRHPAACFGVDQGA